MVPPAEMVAAFGRYMVMSIMSPPAVMTDRRGVARMDRG